MGDAAVRATELHKEYVTSAGTISAVNGVSLEIHQGEAFGLLGPNGAGKTTTVGMLTTRVRPTSGTVWVAGVDVVEDPVAVKRRIGAVSQHNTLDRQLTALENLEFRGRFAGVSRREARRRGLELLDRFQLADRADALVYQMSGGQAQRVMIARALMNRPEVLFLDEPTSGLDPQTRVNLWDSLREMREDGQTIVLTTHYLEEAEALCERIAVVDHGEVLACDTRSALMAAGGDSVITTTFQDDDVPDSVAEALRGRPGITQVQVGRAELRVLTPRVEQVMPALLRASLDADLVVMNVDVHRPSLETVFLALTGREYRE